MTNNIGYFGNQPSYSYSPNYEHFFGQLQDAIAAIKRGNDAFMDLEAACTALRHEDLSHRRDQIRQIVNTKQTTEIQGIFERTGLTAWLQQNN